MDDEGNPRHLWRLELGVTRALDPALPSDNQIAAMTARFRHCGPWVDETHRHERRHPSRRIFSAEVDAHPKGMSWPELQPLPEVMLGPPPGWEPVGSFRARPLVFRIEGTKLHVEWTPPPGANWFDAATGRASEPSRFTISTARRKPTDEEVSTVFAMLGGAAYSEEKRGRSAAKVKGKGTGAGVFGDRGVAAEDGREGLDARPRRVRRLEVHRILEPVERALAFARLAELMPAARERFGVRDLSVFGSVARDEALTKAISTSSSTSWGRRPSTGYMGLKLFLEDSLGVKVNLVTRAALKPRLRARVEAEARRVA